MKGNVDLLYNFYVVDQWLQTLTNIELWELKKIERFGMLLTEGQVLCCAIKSIGKAFGLAAKSARKFNKALDKWEFKG